MNAQLGLDTFGDVTVGDDGERLSDAQTIRDIVDQAVLADQVGLSFFGVGEHHRHEFAVSSPELVLGCGGGPYREHPPRYGRHRPLQ